MTSAPTKMRVAAGQHPDNDREYLDFARQLGCPGVSFQTTYTKVSEVDEDGQVFFGCKVQSRLNVPKAKFYSIYVGANLILDSIPIKVFRAGKARINFDDYAP